MSSNNATIDSPYGQMGLAWHEAADGLRVARIYLPNQWAALDAAQRERASAANQPNAIGELIARMQRFLDGQAVELPLDLLALETCSAFQRKVLLAEYGVPRGWVTTYGRLAAHVGAPGGARAAGGALAGNPFPIVIPCHRAIASDGGLGGYQDGLPMKRRLLEAEGVTISGRGRVLSSRLCHQ
jgi:methylated-DNA-[protein]-cysteine S-methyltransferase